MENVRGKQNEASRRMRKVLLLLPVVLIPLLTIAFYALGGGRGDKSNTTAKTKKGLNMSLPEAKLDKRKTGLNKMGLYEQSARDSMMRREQQKADPYYGLGDSVSGNRRENVSVSSVQPSSIGLKLAPSSTDKQADSMLKELDRLRDMLERKQQLKVPEPPLVSPSLIPDKRHWGSSTMRPGVLTNGGEGDPDLDKLNTLMDKVLKARYPGYTPIQDTEAGDSSSADVEVRAVKMLPAPAENHAIPSLSLDDEGEMQTGFIDIDQRGIRSDSVGGKLFRAVVDKAQTLTSGEVIAFRTEEDAMLGGVLVPRGQRMSGTATISGERLLVRIGAIRVDDRVIPVSLEVLDMDGIPGVLVKGSINREASKDAASQAVGSFGVTPLDPSLAGQATAAGIHATRNLLGRKVREVRVGLPAGYKVLIRNNK